MTPNERHPDTAPTRRARHLATPTALLAIALLIGLAACGGDKDGGGNGTSGAGSSARTPGGDFSRHLRQGIEQIRKFLPDAARAELEKCARLRPEDPDLLFQQARLAFLDPRPNIPAIVGLVEQVIALDPDHVAARRMRAEIAFRTRDAQRTELERKEIERILGAPGTMEMFTFAQMLQGGSGVRFGQVRPDAEGFRDWTLFRESFRLLQRMGEYNPGEAVPRLERLLEKYDALAATRLHYATLLVLGQVRVPNSDIRPDLPPMSSALILDVAQSHLEKAFDLMNPRSPQALLAITGLMRVALQMGDWEDAKVYADAVLVQPELQQGARSEILGEKAVAEYKLGNYEAAAKLLDDGIRNAPAGFSRAPAMKWLLRLAHEQLGTPENKRGLAHKLRSDLARPGDVTELAFREEASELGIDKLDGLGPSAWADVDGDGDYDLYVSGCDSYGALYRNDGNETFVDISRESGLFHVQSGYSATFVDIDGDNDSDLYICRDGWNGTSPNSLYENDGKGNFKDITAESGLLDDGASFMHAWSDVDRDGDLDVFIAKGITGAGDTNRLYLNDGKGRFTDGTEAAGLSEPKGTKTMGLAFGDYDLDGWPDLFISGFNMKSRLYHNKGDGTFEEVGDEAGVSGKDTIATGYVAFFFDYDGDAYPDILKTVLAPWDMVLESISIDFDKASAQRKQAILGQCPRLFRNNRDGTFTDVTEEAGLVHPAGIMGANVFDLDNDGWLDILFGTGDPDLIRMEPDRFWHNNGDGDLEVYAPEGGFVHGDAWRNAFYRNLQTTGNHWLTIDIVGPPGNMRGVDARLVAHAGKLKVLREIKNGQGFGSTLPQTVHFGLGKEAKIDKLEVRWSDGKTQTFENVTPDAHYRLRHGKELEKLETL